MEDAHRAPSGGKSAGASGRMDAIPWMSTHDTFRDAAIQIPARRARPELGKKRVRGRAADQPVRSLISNIASSTGEMKGPLSKTITSFFV